MSPPQQACSPSGGSEPRAAGSVGATCGFSRDWLALREPFDRAARAAGDAAMAAHRPAGLLQVLDLGCGTGSSLRALAPRLGGAQRWCLVDHDPDLLAAAPQAIRPWAERQDLQVAWSCHRAELATGLADLPFPQHGLVTASALLDLVSEAWLTELVARCRAAGAAVCWSLSVDGRLDFTPADPADAQVLALFAAHQRRDKGFGPALGETAPARADALLRTAGYRTLLAQSDWHIAGARGADDQAMLQALVEGMAMAAQEQGPAQAGAVQTWRARRLAGLAGTRLCVGHTDLVGYLEALR
ncbi:class I SAM-dependent methyltransferase [Pseudorhodoferax sp. LjRoot39]|uniref:class I SAM-dependent methyltransferase n=1 Tax=Pseudorhodoferax sp. LjRoot39 TaxID=3342328 RepID=UPI003ECCC64D